MIWCERSTKPCLLWPPWGLWNKFSPWWGTTDYAEWSFCTQCRHHFEHPLVVGEQKHWSIFKIYTVLPIWTWRKIRNCRNMMFYQSEWSSQSICVTTTLILWCNSSYFSWDKNEHLKFPLKVNTRTHLNTPQNYSSAFLGFLRVLSFSGFIIWWVNFCFWVNVALTAGLVFIFYGTEALKDAVKRNSTIETFQLSH